MEKFIDQELAKFTNLVPVLIRERNYLKILDCLGSVRLIQYIPGLSDSQYNRTVQLIQLLRDSVRDDPRTSSTVSNKKFLQHNIPMYEARYANLISRIRELDETRKYLETETISMFGQLQQLREQLLDIEINEALIGE